MKLIFLLTILTLLVLSQGLEELIVNGDFELPKANTINYFKDGKLPGWHTDSLIERNFAKTYTSLWQGDNKVVQLDSDQNIKMWQNIELQADQNLLLSWDCIARSEFKKSSSMKVYWNNQLIKDSQSIPEKNIQHLEMTVKGIKGKNTILFQGTSGSDSYGAIVDNISLKPIGEIQKKGQINGQLRIQSSQGQRGSQLEQKSIQFQSSSKKYSSEIGTNSASLSSQNFGQSGSSSIRQSGSSGFGQSGSSSMQQSGSSGFGQSGSSSMQQSGSSGLGQSGSSGFGQSGSSGYEQSGSSSMQQSGSSGFGQSGSSGFGQSGSSSMQQSGSSGFGQSGSSGYGQSGSSSIRQSGSSGFGQSGSSSMQQSGSLGFGQSGSGMGQSSSIRNNLGYNMRSTTSTNRPTSQCMMRNGRPAYGSNMHGYGYLQCLALMSSNMFRQ